VAWDDILMSGATVEHTNHYANVMLSGNGL